jgi:hypothetical protein
MALTSGCIALGCLLFVIASTSAEQIKHPVVLVPGFASGRLRTWRDASCKAEVAGLEIGGRGVGWDVGDSVWINTPMIVGQRACWLRCMGLVNGTDPEPGADGMGACKLRADEGLDAISKLDPGVITGPLTDVWWTFIQTMANELGVAPDNGIVAAPFDWRLSPRKLQERDNYFTKFRHLIEEQVLKRPGNVNCETDTALCPGAVVVAHSMGNNIFRYFCEWLESDLGTLHYKKWLDRYIYLFVGVGAPWLGAAEGIRTMFSGNTFGLPISVNEAREMGKSFGSGPLMMPVTVPGETTDGNSHINIKFEHPQGEDIYAAKGLWSGKQGPFETMRKNGDETGSMFYDAFEEALNDPFVDIQTAPKRLPIRRIVCAYGVNRATEAGFHYTWDANNKRPVLEEVIYEQPLVDSKALDFQKALADDLAHKSGDGTVNYASLAWCKRWMGGGKANITMVPEGHLLSDDATVRCEDCDMKKFAVDHKGKIGNTYYENAAVDENGEEQFTQIWEFENAEHRDTIKSPPFLREFTSLLAASYVESESAKVKVGGLSSITERKGGTPDPKNDKECKWDYSNMECMHPTICNYDYHFGDIHLSQSCRLRKVAAPEDIKTEDELELTECECLSGCLEGFCKYKQNCKNTATMPFGPSNGWWGPCHAGATAVAPPQAVAAPVETSEPEADGSCDNSEALMLKGQLLDCTQRLAAASDKKCPAAAAASVIDAPPGSVCVSQTRVVIFTVFLLMALFMVCSPMTQFNADVRTK